MRANFDQELQWIFKDKYGGRWRPKLLLDAQRLAAGEPVDYIIGWQPFLNCRIDLSLRPFIPRPETGFWVEQVIVAIKKRRGCVRVLDLGAGSGAIGVAILKNAARARVDLVELDKRFIQQIKINLKKNKIAPGRARIIQSDVFSDTRGQYDVIVVNPPYIPTKNKQKVAKSVLRYEPVQALFSGKNGLVIIKKILAQAPAHLRLGGELWLEFDSQQKPAIAKLLKINGYKNWIFGRDQYGQWRYVRATVKADDVL